MRRLVVVVLGIFGVAAALQCNCQKTTSTGGDSGSSSEGGTPPDGGAVPGGDASVSVDAGESELMHHKTLDRKGMYIQPALTKAAVTGANDAGLKLDTTFVATLPDPNDSVYAQPLYVDRAGTGPDLVIVATEADNVYALDATSGAQVWVQNLGAPVPLANLPCGNIDPVGITGTPVIDPVTRTIFVDAEILAAGGVPKHEVFGLAVDTGAIRTGWPVDVTSVATPLFSSPNQGERGALTVLGGAVYVPYGGRYGDCAPYRGRVVGISISDPSQVQNWATAASAGGAWGPSGISSDGFNLFVATGNTQGATTWGGGEAVLRLAPGSFATPAYWAPPNWHDLDNSDLDIGGVGPVLLDLPGSTPQQLAIAFGKDGNAYLLDRNNLGGISPALGSKSGSYQSAHVATAEIITAPVIYTTATATYVALRGPGALCTGGTSGDLMALKITPGSPPTITGSWCASAGAGSPIVTTSDGQADAIVWQTGADGDNRLHAFDGDTGAAISFPGSSAVVKKMRRYNAPIAAKGRIFVAADRTVAAFGL
jgi:outer membrane protein assembly factor BamB